MLRLTTLGLCLITAVSASADQINGEYLEARNADVWTGPCFANAEIGIVGDRGVMAWKVTRGSHQGVALDGLSIIAVVVGDNTFGIDEPVNTRTYFIVDKKASPGQQAALIAMAKDLAGDTIQKVVGVRRDGIEMTTAYCDGMGCASVKSSDVVVKTRCMKAGDAICTNETLYYPALAKVQNEYAAFTLQNEYKGKHLGTTFADSGARSAIIASFAALD